MEVRAAARWAAWAWSPQVLWTDCDVVVKGMAKLQGLGDAKLPQRMKHRDLWFRIQRAIWAKGKDNLVVEKVKGHAKLADCEGDLDLIEQRRRNNKADEAAVAGAKEHAPPEILARRFARHAQLTRVLQF